MRRNQREGSEIEGQAEEVFSSSIAMTGSPFTRCKYQKKSVFFEFNVYHIDF